MCPFRISHNDNSAIPVFTLPTFLLTEPNASLIPCPAMRVTLIRLKWTAEIPSQFIASPFATLKKERLRGYIKVVTLTR